MRPKDEVLYRPNWPETPYFVLCPAGSETLAQIRRLPGLPVTCSSAPLRGKIKNHPDSGKSDMISALPGIDAGGSNDSPDLTLVGFLSSDLQ